MSLCHAYLLVFSLDIAMFPRKSFTVEGILMLNGKIAVKILAAVCVVAYITHRHQFQHLSNLKFVISNCHATVILTIQYVVLLFKH